MAQSPFTPIRHHVLLPWADAIEDAALAAQDRLTPSVFTSILNAVPDAWLLPEQDIPTAPAKRAAYVEYLTRRLAASPLFVQEAIRARANLV